MVSANMMEEMFIITAVADAWLWKHMTSKVSLTGARLAVNDFPDLV